MYDVTVTEERIKQLIDEDDIRKVLYRYTECVDTKKWQEWANLYAEDGSFVAPFARHDGREGLAEFAGNALASFDLTHHNMLQQQIEINGNTATVHQSGIAWHTPSKDDLGTNFSEGGYYEITMVRTPDGWKIQSCVEDVHWTMGRDATGLAG